MTEISKETIKEVLENYFDGEYIEKAVNESIIKLGAKLKDSKSYCSDAIIEKLANDHDLPVETIRRLIDKHQDGQVLGTWVFI